MKTAMCIFLRFYLPIDTPLQIALVTIFNVQFHKALKIQWRAYFSFLFFKCWFIWFLNQIFHPTLWLFYSGFWWNSMGKASNEKKNVVCLRVCTIYRTIQQMIRQICSLNMSVIHIETTTCCLWCIYLQKLLRMCGD